MAFITTPNMGLTIPGPTTEPGPNYAFEVNSSLNLIDGHNHTPGLGVAIPTSGLNINADLPFGGNNATTLRSVRFSSQNSPISDALDIGCLYDTNGDLYYNDGNGNQIRITESGGIAGTPGSISNLTSPASAAYVSANQTFVWQSDSATPANLDAASIILRNLLVNSKGLTLQPPAAMAHNYSITLPSLPGNSSFLTITSSGTMSATIPISAGLTSANLSASAGITGGQISASAAISGTQLSSSAGITPGQTDSLSTGYFDDNASITSLSVNSTTGVFVMTSSIPTAFTTNKPVFINFQNDGNGGSTTITVPPTSTIALSPTSSITLTIVRVGPMTTSFLNSVTLSNFVVSANTTDQICFPASALNCVDLFPDGSRPHYRLIASVSSTLYTAVLSDIVMQVVQV